MAFTYESIDTARCHEILALAKPRTVLSMSRIQIIDRERDIVFVALVGKGELGKGEPGGDYPPNGYAMLWQGQPILFEAYIKNWGEGEVLHSQLTTTFMSIPKVLQHLMPEIRQAIVDALCCFKEQGNASLQGRYHFSLEIPRVGVV